MHSSTTTPISPDLSTWRVFALLVGHVNSLLLPPEARQESSIISLGSLAPQGFNRGGTCTFLSAVSLALLPPIPFLGATNRPHAVITCLAQAVQTLLALPTHGQKVGEPSEYTMDRPSPRYAEV